MTVSFPDVVWDGDFANRNSDNNPRKSPDWRDWNRMVEEVAATQTRVTANGVGRDDDVIDGPGTLAATSGLSVVEKGDGAVHKTVITLDEVEVTMIDGTTPATDAMHGTVPLYTFPTGALVLLGGYQVYPLGKIEAVTGGGAGLSDTADLEIGAGTTVRPNRDNFALTNAEKNLIPGQSGIDLVNKLSDTIETSQLSSVYLTATQTAVANLNIVTLDDDDAGTASDVLKISGTITFTWTIQGDS